MKKSTLVLLAMYAAWGFTFMTIGPQLDFDGLSGILFSLVMILIIWLLIFNKPLDDWLKKLDGDD